MGSNLGNRLAYLRAAVDALSRVLLDLRHSAVYETAPVGGPPQPPYLNLVVEGRTDLDPWSLLDRLQAIENACGRVRAVRFGPRTLDLDLLWYGGRHFSDARLTVPHPRMFERRFVLEPLRDLGVELPGPPVAEAVWRQPVIQLGHWGPDPATAEAWRAALKTRWVGQTLEYHRVLDSTNERLRQWQAAGAPAGAAVVAQAQTDGRGRRGKSWGVQPGEGLATSFLLPLDPLPASGLWSLMAGVAVASAIEAQYALAPGLKWPNDVLLDGRKVGGILIQTAGRFAVTGIGLNVQGQALPEWGEATSLEVATGRRLPLKEVWAAVALALEQWVEAWVRGGRDQILEAWRRYSVTLNRPVTVLGPSGPIAGWAEGIDGEGALWVNADGRRLRVTAGEVSLRHRDG